MLVDDDVSDWAKELLLSVVLAQVSRTERECEYRECRQEEQSNV